MYDNSLYKMSLCLVFAGCLLLNFMNFATARIHVPHCPLFHYEEKILEKLVRMEHRMEILEDKLTDRLKDLEAEVSDRKAEIKDLQEDPQNHRDTVRESTAVSFMAQLRGDIINPTKGLVVKFDDVITNEGSPYDSKQGIFTAPLRGVYNFNLVASSPSSSPGHQLHLFIMKSGVQVGYVFLDGNVSYWLRRSTDITVKLNAEDQVWVEVSECIQSNILAGCCFHTHFSGFLISAL